MFQYIPALLPKLQVVFAHRHHARHASHASKARRAGREPDYFRSGEAGGSVVKIALIFIILFIFPSLLFAKREHPEKWYQEQWCEAHNGQLEITMPDGTRCDCVTDTHAIEFDFGNNWAEAIGQSAYYSLQTEKCLVPR